MSATDLATINDTLDVILKLFILSRFWLDALSLKTLLSYSTQKGSKAHRYYISNSLHFCRSDFKITQCNTNVRDKSAKNQLQIAPTEVYLNVTHVLQTFIPLTKEGLNVLFPLHNSSSFQSKLIPGQKFFCFTCAPKCNAKAAS